MKVLWVAETTVNTGFSRVSNSLLKHLQKIMDITIIDFYNKTSQVYKGFKMIPGKDDDPLSIRAMVKEYPKYDAVFILNDIWIVDQYLAALKQEKQRNKKFNLRKNVVIYFPVDAKEHSPGWYENVDIAKPITYTNFAVDVIRKVNPIVAKNTAIIPHGIDTSLFFKSMSSKSSIRQSIYKTDRFNDSFIFLNANRNQPRKKLDITMKAFALFVNKVKPKNAILHMHCGVIDQYINVMELAKRYGLRDVITCQVSGIPNMTNEEMNMIYNAADVGLNSSIGEGWGLCNTEHAATGAPQIVPNHSACAELFGKNVGLLVDAPTDIMQTHYMTVGRLPSTEDMAQKMGLFYSRRDIYKAHANACLKKFNSPEYQWESIAGKFATEIEKAAKAGAFATK